VVVAKKRNTRKKEKIVVVDAEVIKVITIITIITTVITNGKHQICDYPI